MKYVFAESPGFTVQVLDYFGDDEEFSRFQAFLSENPRRGKVIQGTGGVRKVRWEDRARGKGKRGGLRVAYLFVQAHSRILLLEVYGKNEQDDMTAAEKRLARELAEAYKRKLDEGGRKR